MIQKSKQSERTINHMAKELKFEDKMNRLSEIVDALEKEETGLDESLALYEEGLKLSKALKTELKQFEDKVKEIGESDE